MKKCLLLMMSAVVAFSITSCKKSSRDNLAIFLTQLLKSSPTGAITGIAVQGSMDWSMGLINDNRITVTLPCSDSADFTNLRVAFTITGDHVLNGTTPVSSGDFLDFSDDVILTVVDENGDERNYTVEVALADGAAKAITSFSINNVAGVIDEGAHTITVTLPSSTSDVTSLKALFTYNGDTITVVGTPQLLGVTTNNFTTPVTYTITPCTGVPQDYITTVIVAECEGAVWDCSKWDNAMWEP